MNTKKLWIVETAKVVPLQKDDSASFIGRVREVINVIRAGRPPRDGVRSGEHAVSENPKKHEES
jgi:hypothetical protein